MANNEEGQKQGARRILESKKDAKTQLNAPGQSVDAGDDANAATIPPSAEVHSSEPLHQKRVAEIHDQGKTRVTGSDGGVLHASAPAPLHGADGGETLAPGAFHASNSGRGSSATDHSHPSETLKSAGAANKSESLERKSSDSTLTGKSQDTLFKNSPAGSSNKGAGSGHGRPTPEKSDQTIHIPAADAPARPHASQAASDATIAPGSVFEASTSSVPDSTIPAGAMSVSQVPSPGSSPALDHSDATLAPGMLAGDGGAKTTDATLHGSSRSSLTHIGPYPDSEATLAPGSHMASYPGAEATLAPGSIPGYTGSDATLAPGGMSASSLDASSDATMAPGSQWSSGISDGTIPIGQAADSGVTMAHGSQTGSGTVPAGQSPASKGPTIRYPGSRGDKTESTSNAVDSKGNRLPVITGYELLGELGRGGMGVVYRARQKGLGRMVALKMVLNNQASQEELDRFMLEAQAVALVEHPNIVQIYDVGEYNMLPYFSLEFVDGGPLDKKLNSEPQDPMFTGQVMAKLCRAMGYAHSKKILHRDLKPANVLLTKGGEPKITDFGLAKQMDAPDEGHTKAGSIMGTPSYMPPEQAEGKAKDLTNRADIYSLGAILYEFITGRPPFKGRTLLETLQHVRTKEPVPPVQLQPSVPPDLQTICLKALEKDPAKRYPTAEEMAEDLECYLKGDPIKARPISQMEKAVRWARRNKPQAALIAMAAAMVCLIIAGGFVYLGLDAHNQRLRAERVEKINQDRKEAEALLDQAVREGLEQKWTESRTTALQARAQLGDDEEVEEVRQKVTEQIDLAVSHLETDSKRAQFDGLVDKAYYYATDLTGENAATNTREAIDQATKALELFEVKVGVRDFDPKFGEHFEPTQRKRITAECVALLLLVASRQLDRDFTQNKPLEGILPILEAAEKGGASKKILHLLRARVYQAMANRDPKDQTAQAQATKEWDAQAKLNPEGPRDWFMIGDDLFRKGDFTRASEAFAELSRLSPKDFWAVYYQAICAIRRESWAEAAALVQNCIARNEEFAYSYILMGIAEGKLKNFTLAESFFEKAKSLLGEPINLLGNRAAVRFDEGKFDLAEADLRKAIKLDSNNWQALDNLGMVLRKKGQLNEALSSFSQAERNSGTELGPMRHLAGLYGEFDPPMWDRAVEVYQRIVQREQDPIKLARDYTGLATAYLGQGDFQKAKTALDTSIQKDAENPITHFLYGNVVNELAASQEKILNQVATVQANVDKKAIETLYRTAVKAYDRGIELTSKGKSDPQQSQSLTEFFRKQDPEGNAELLESRILRSRGFIKARLGDYGGAMFDYTRSLELFADQPALRIRRGTAMISKWREIALLDYNEAIKLNPNDLEAYAGRAFVNATLGKHEEVIKDTDIILKTKNTAVGAQINAACALAQAYRFAKEPVLGATPSSKETQDLYLQNLWAMIQKTMGLVPEPQWKKVWSQNFRGDDAFDPVRNLPEWKAFDKKFAGS